MNINRAVLTSCLVLAGTTASAQQALNPPKMAVQDTEHHHGIPEQKDLRAPTASIQKHQESVHSLSKHSIDTSKIKLKASAQAVQAAVCDVNSFATSNSNQLINAIKTMGSDCVNELFGAASNIQSSAYTSDNMYAVANHVKGLAQSYTGGGDVDIEAMFLYLRAGYYVEFYNDAVTFSSWVKPAVKGAIDAFVNNANFYQDNDAHGKTLSEVLITMDSSEQQDVYLPVVREWLSRWNQSMGQKWNMRSAVNGIFTILFRGQYNNNFKTLIANDTTLVQNLQNFVMSSWMINSESEYLIANAARELGRLKMYTGAAIQPAVDTALNAVFNSSYQSYGFGDAVWLGAADTAGYYADCTTYGICNYKAELEAQVLAQTHVCGPTIKIRSTNLTATQQAAACSKMEYEETYFHSKLQTGSVPIPGDNNSQLVVNIFDSNADYGKYAGHIFGIDTNNGGMYLEGNPSDPNNIPNFVAYEASYANADHYVWNLEHEYVHYLDGRFDLYGDFNNPTQPVVWWAEGVAEYVANQDFNQAAIDTINDGSTYTLGAVFDTTYAGFDQDRIYRWGYLAVRFMFERHFSEVKAMLAETRAGNWTAYKSRLNTWAANYGSEFTTWTQGLSNGTPPPPTGNINPTASANGPYNAAVNTAVNFSSAGSSDSDGTITSYLWDFGDGNTSTQANPSHTYTTAGDYLAKLTVTDNENGTGRASASVTISAASTGNSIANGETKSNLAASAGEWLYYTIDVPANATDFVVTTSGGSGDVDMYTRLGAQPTTSTYQCRPYASGNNESCTEANPSAGTWHIGLRAYSTFSGLSLTASYNTNQTTPNVAPVAQINGPYSAAENTAINFSSAGSSDSDGSITSYSWSFGDGTTSTQANPSHSYSTAGTYAVSLTVTDNEGATHTANTSANVSSVNQAPSVVINGPYSGDVDTAVSFSSAGSSDSDGSIASYSWNFGDGTTSTQANPTHTYTSAGTFTVSLSVTDDQGMTDTASTSATIAGVVTPPPSTTALVNGAANAISGSQDSVTNFTFDVPAGATDLRIALNGGSGDADLYVNFGSEATKSNFECRPYQSGNTEVCDITNVQAGTYHIMVNGYNTYSTTLTASFTEPSGGSTGNVPNACAVQGPQTSGQLNNGEAICLGNADPIWLSFGEVSEYSSMAISVGNGTGDVDIDFSNFGWPNSSNTQGSSSNAGNNECIYLTNLSEYWGYIKVTGNADGASLVVDFDTAGCR